jgi:hypothetical protein
VQTLTMYRNLIELNHKELQTEQGNLIVRGISGERGKTGTRLQLDTAVLLGSHCDTYSARDRS